MQYRGGKLNWDLVRELRPAVGKVIDLSFPRKFGAISLISVIEGFVDQRETSAKNSDTGRCDSRRLLQLR